MKKTTLGIVAILAVATLAGCNLNKTTEIANPASVYCEENGGTLVLEEGAGLCMFEDGSYCEEWAYKNGECQPGDIFYNTLDEDTEPTETAAYTQEDLDAAEAAIRNYFENEMTVKVENIELTYLGDEKAAENLSYCQELNAEVEECVVYSSSFYIPEQEAEMAGAFAPDTTLTDYEWYLGRANGGEWKVLTMGY